MPADRVMKQVVTGVITRLSAQSKTNTKHIRVQKGRKQGRKPDASGYRKACQGQEIVMPRLETSRTRRVGGMTISCPSLFKLNKDSTLYKSPAKSHFAPNFRENALSGVASTRKKTAAFPCTLCRCLRKRKKATASWVWLAASRDTQGY